MNAKLVRVTDYLLDAEIREPDIWLQQDMRLASIVLDMVAEGRKSPYEMAFLRTYGKHAEDVVWWWRDREKLLFLSEHVNRPTPLLLFNYAEELLLGEWVEIADHGWVPKAAATRFLILKRQEVRREYMAEWQRDYRAEHKVQAVCIECAQPVCPESKTRCAKHHQANRERVARHEQRRVARGICRNCPLPVEAPSRHFCAFHREKQNVRTRAYMQRRRALKTMQREAA